MIEDSSDSLRRLYHAIATDDDTTVLRLIEQSPSLASEGVTDGATRQNATTTFIEEIGHHVYTGDTALHIAAAAYRTTIAKALVASGASVRATNRRGAQPLHYASDGNPADARWKPEAQSAVITYLAEIGADLNAVDMNGVAPLHRAVRTRSTAAVKTLVALGADVRMKNGNGSTPLHLAVQNTGRGGSGTTAAKAEQAVIIQFLLEHGAKLTDTDNQGRMVSESITSGWVRDLVQAHH